MYSQSDPRVLFAAERTLFSWTRTGISLMAFGFVVERFGLYMQLLGVQGVLGVQRHQRWSPLFGQEVAVS